MKTFISDTFQVPLRLERENFVLLPLTIKHNNLDYEAIKKSIDNKGEIDQRLANLTKEQNMIELGWHQREFQFRRSFAYTVLTQDESKCIGCVYIQPPNYIPHHIYPEQTDPAVDAEVYMWVTKEEYDKGTLTELHAVVKKWLHEKWPFKKTAFPRYLY